MAMNKILAGAVAALFAFATLDVSAAGVSPTTAGIVLGKTKPRSGGGTAPAPTATTPAPTPATPPAAEAPATETPVAATESDSEVLGDIDQTLNDLSGHLRVGPKRLRVNPPGNNKRVAELPVQLQLTAGKSHPVDLPRDAREVVVGNPDVADVTVTSRRRIFILARKAGHTNVTVLDADGDTLAQVEVAVGPNAEAARAALTRQLPGEAVEVTAEGTSLLLAGQVSSDGLAGRAYRIARRFVEKDEDIVSLIKINREQQVLLQVRVAEVQRNILKEIGVGTTVSDGAKFFSDLNLTGTFTPTTLTAARTFAFAGIKGLLVNLDMLETRGLVRNLAEPNMVAVSGETATMLAGGEYPIPVPDRDGIKIEYKPFGVTLSFLPVVLDAGKISLKLTTEVSSLSSKTVDVPTLTGTAKVNAFTVRRASSTVELPSGGSLMIAGLMQNDIIAGLKGLPGLMDVPVLGRLFHSDSFERNETELVVMVTASLVRPAAAATLVAPTDALSPGGDLDLWVFGKLTGTYSSGFVRENDKFKPQPLRLFGYSIDEFVP